MIAYLLLLALAQLVLPSLGSSITVVPRLADVTVPVVNLNLSDAEWQKLIDANKPKIDDPKAPTIKQPKIAGQTSNAVGAYIIGGSKATLGQFPWQALFYANDAFMCGGSLILSQWVLTAAHCIGVYFTVILGTISRTSYSPGHIVLYTDTAFRHEAWNTVTLNNDIGLIKFRAPVTFTANISPVKLPPASDATKTFGGIMAVVSGFGKTGDTTEASNDLMFTDVLTISYESCVYMYGTTLVTASVICTQQIAGQATCSGDSGGALVYKDATNTWVQIGIVSFGSALSCLHKPSAYTRVTSFLGWISSKVAQNPLSVTVTTPKATATTRRLTTRRTTLKYGQQIP